MSDNDKAKIDDGGPAFPAGIQMRDPVTLEWGDLPPQGMSLRAYAAIKLRVPDSGIDWLDAMIVKAKRDEFAGMEVQGFMECQGISDHYEGTAGGGK
jgi:hypothetical protein